MNINGHRSNTNVLIDGHNVLYRSFFAYVERKDADLQIRSRAFNPEWSIELVYGTLSLMSTFLREIAGAHQLHVFFDGKPTRRNNTFAEYKAGRETKKVNSYLDIDVEGIRGRGEVEFLSGFLRHAGANIFYDPNEETDDLIASFCKKNAQDVNIIISDDRDFFQLIHGKTVQYRPCTKKFYDAEEIPRYMEEKYKVRVGASGIRMFKTLTGDSSDNIVGIPRIRKKLVEPFCDMNIEEFLAADHKVFSPKERAAIEEGKARLRLNWDLVTFYEDLDFESAKKPAIPNFELCERALDKMNISSIDLAPFRRIRPQPSVPVARISEIPDWLADI